MSCHLYSQLWSTYNTWRMFADLWRVGRSCLEEKELRAGPVALAARIYPGDGEGPAALFLTCRPPHLHLGAPTPSSLTLFLVGSALSC